MEKIVDSGKDFKDFIRRDFEDQCLQHGSISLKNFLLIDLYPNYSNSNIVWKISFIIKEEL